MVYFYLILFLVVFVIAVGIVERKVRRRKKHAVEELYELARTLECSEYDIFESAGRRWNFSQGKIKGDFKAYIINNDLPHYVREYVSKTSGGG